MNNEKLKIDLCGRLPYNPKVEIYEEVTYTTTVSEINLINVLNREFKPLLFPISYLTKPIQLADYNKGELIVPMRTLFYYVDEFDYTCFAGEDDDWKYEYGCFDGFNYSLNINNGHQELCFYFDSDSKSFTLMVDSEVQILSNQLELFDLLNRWKIDYRGLINEGLAIEVNEENNPYL